MLSAVLAGFAGGIAWAAFSRLWAWIVNRGLKSAGERPIIANMAAPGRGRIQRRTPKANDDLKAFQYEIKEQELNRG